MRYETNDPTDRFSAQSLWKETQTAQLSTEQRSREALAALEGVRLAQATCHAIVKSALQGKHDCVVSWVVPKVSLKGLGYTMVKVVRDHHVLEELKAKAALARQALELAFDRYERGRYEWGGASGSVIGDHSSFIEYFVQCAKDGVDFSTITPAELMNIHIRKSGAAIVSLDKLHLFVPLLAALEQCVPPLVRLDATAFEYRGLAEDLDRGTRISWADGAIGVPFSRDWPTAKEARWLAQYWNRAKWYFRTAIGEAAEGGMHSTLYAVHNWGCLLTFYKPLTIAEEVSGAILRDATQNGNVEGEAEAEGGGDAVDDGSYEVIQPIDNLFRPIAIALTHYGFSVKCVDAATVDGLIPPARPSNSEVVVTFGGVDAQGNGTAGQPHEPIGAQTPGTCFFEISWRPMSNFDVRESDMENYRLHLGTALDELQLGGDVEEVERDD